MDMILVFNTVSAQVVETVKGVWVWSHPEKAKEKNTNMYKQDKVNYKVSETDGTARQVWQLWLGWQGETAEWALLGFTGH